MTIDNLIHCSDYFHDIVSKISLVHRVNEELTLIKFCESWSDWVDTISDLNTPLDDVVVTILGNHLNRVET